MADEREPGRADDSLNYEINLCCANCGHVQFMHCDDHADPCGCLMTRLWQIKGSSRTCTCQAFVRPPDARPVRDEVWMDPDHRAEGEKSA